jgi:hypothetical protein
LVGCLQGVEATAREACEGGLVWLLAAYKAVIDDKAAAAANAAAVCLRVYGPRL